MFLTNGSCILSLAGLPAYIERSVGVIRAVGGAQAPGLYLEDDAPSERRELDEAHKTIRSLLRQLDKQQSRFQEIARAYNLTVGNLTEISRQNTLLERERDLWRSRARTIPAPVGGGTGMPELTPAEVAAIRKAMARLHHPDTGGDGERLKAWNAALDALER